MERLFELLSCLVHALDRDREQREREHEWMKAHSGLATKFDLHEMEKRIMATQQDLVADLKTANAQLRKLINDTAGLQPSVDALKAKIAELEALVAAGGTIGQELVDAVAETKSLVNAVDDNVPELPAQPTAPPS